MLPAAGSPPARGDAPAGSPARANDTSRAPKLWPTRCTRTPARQRCRAAGRGRSGRPCPRGSSSASTSPGAAPPSPRAAARPAASPNPRARRLRCRRAPRRSRPSASRYRPKSVGVVVERASAARRCAGPRRPCRPRRRPGYRGGEPGELPQLTAGTPRAPPSSAGPCQEGRHRVQRCSARGEQRAQVRPASPASRVGSASGSVVAHRLRRGRPPPPTRVAVRREVRDRLVGPALRRPEHARQSDSAARSRLRDLAAENAEEARCRAPSRCGGRCSSRARRRSRRSRHGPEPRRGTVSCCPRSGSPCSSKVNSQNGNPAISAAMYATSLSSDGLQGAHEVEQALPSKVGARARGRSRSRRRSASPARGNR